MSTVRLWPAVFVSYDPDLRRWLRVSKGADAFWVYWRLPWRP